MEHLMNMFSQRFGELGRRLLPLVIGLLVILIGAVVLFTVGLLERASDMTRLGGIGVILILVLAAAAALVTWMKTKHQTSIPGSAQGHASQHESWTPSHQSHRTRSRTSQYGSESLEVVISRPRQPTRPAPSVIDVVQHAGTNSPQDKEALWRLYRRHFQDGRWEDALSTLQDYVDAGGDPERAERNRRTIQGQLGRRGDGS